MGIHCARCGKTIEGPGYWAAIHDVTITGDTWRLHSSERKAGIFYCRDCLKVVNPSES